MFGIYLQAQEDDLKKKKRKKEMKKQTYICPQYSQNRINVKVSHFAVVLGKVD